MKLFISLILVLVALSNPTFAANYAQVFDALLTSQRSAGVTLSGGKAYFYVPGTTTLKTVYSSRSKTIAANPYTLSSDGTAMLYGDGLYDVKITNSAGVQKYLWEDVSLKDASGSFYDLADYADLPAAVTAIGSTPATLIIATPIVLTTAVAIPSTMELMFINGAYVTFTGSGALTGLEEAKPEQFYAGGGDYAVALQKAVLAVENGGKRIIFDGTYVIGSTIYITKKGVKFIGRKGATDSGTAVLSYTGTGAMIELGTDNGHAYDASDYDGDAQGFSVSDMALTYSGATTTALLNGKGVYGTGTTGIKDWRGGSIELSNVQISHFAFGFWGIQSDLNVFNNTTFSYNGVGSYLGPRSDQFTAYRGWSAFNDIVIQFDSVMQSTLNQWTTDSDGSPTTTPFTIIGQYSRGTRGVIFNDCWYENYTGTAGQVVPAFIGIGVTQANTNKNIIINNPIILTSASTTTPRTSALVQIGLSTGVVINNPTDPASGNNITIDKLIEVVGTNSPVNKVVYGLQLPATTVLNSGGGSPITRIFTLDSGEVGDGSGGVFLDINPFPTTTNQQSVVRHSRLVNTSGTAGVYWYTADGTAKLAATLDQKNHKFNVYNSAGSGIVHSLDGLGNAGIGVSSTGAWDQPHLILGTFHIYTEGGKLVGKDGAPTGLGQGSAFW